jgi:hypothetical protein
MDAAVARRVSLRRRGHGKDIMKQQEKRHLAMFGVYPRARPAEEAMARDDVTEPGSVDHALLQFRIHGRAGGGAAGRTEAQRNRLIDEPILSGEIEPARTLDIPLLGCDGQVAAALASEPAVGPPQSWGGRLSRP